MLIKTISVDCECFEDLAIKQGITIISQKNIDKNTCLYSFTRKDGSEGWASETSKIYAPDGYVTTINVYNTKEDAHD